MRIKRFLLNAAILAGTSLFMRTVSVSFNVYITSKIGAAGMGLFSLIMSVYTLAVTFACSGISLATTRLCAEYIAKNDTEGAKRTVRCCSLYSIVFGTAASVILFFGARYIGCTWLGDERTVASIRLLSLSLVPLSLSSVLSGYFTAVRRVAKTAAAGLFEQLLKIALTALFLRLISFCGMEYACLALVGGSTVSELCSFFLALILYFFDRRRYLGAKKQKDAPGYKNVFRRMLLVSLPVAVSAYVRSGLLTLEHVLIPRGLKSSGASAERALAAYGTIHGMVFPVILFPSALLGAISGLVVPELTEMGARGQPQSTARTIGRALRYTLLFAIGAAGAISHLATEIGLCFYDSREAARYIKVFCVLVPVMYLDGIVDGILKGLGEQVASMRYNIADSAISVILVYTLLPDMGIDGYIITVFVTELLNSTLSLHRLLSVCPVKIRIVKWVLKPLLCAVGAANFGEVIFKVANIRFSFDYVSLAVRIAVFAILYLAFAQSVGSLDVKSIVRRARGLREVG